PPRQSPPFPYTTLFRSGPIERRPFGGPAEPAESPREIATDAILGPVKAAQEVVDAGQTAVGEVEGGVTGTGGLPAEPAEALARRSEEHTSELQSPYDLV